MADFIHHLTGVINRAVVGTKLDDRQTERAFVTCAVWRDFCYQLTQIAFFKAVGVDAADKAVRVTCGFQVDRCGTSLQQRAVVVGFVVVTVKQH